MEERVVTTVTVEVLAIGKHCSPRCRFLLDTGGPVAQCNILNPPEYPKIDTVYFDGESCYFLRSDTCLILDEDLSGENSAEEGLDGSGSIRI